MFRGNGILSKLNKPLKQWTSEIGCGQLPGRSIHRETEVRSILRKNKVERPTHKYSPRPYRLKNSFAN